MDPDEAVVVAPDVGGAKSADRFAQMVGLPSAAGNKTRISDSEVRIRGLIGRQVKGFKKALVFDDEIATGGTIVEICRLLVDEGIEEITVICTHGLFLGKAPERLAAIPQVHEVVTTDTVTHSEDQKQRMPNLKVISTAPIFSGAIWQNYHRRSIGELFDFGGKE